MPTSRPLSVRVRRVGVALGFVVVALPAPLLRAATTSVTATSTTLDQASDTTFAYDLDNEPSQCIGFLPKPDCGKKPEQAGDRGGALQYATFGIILAAVAFIGTVIARNVARRDKAIAASLAERENPPN